MKKYKFYGWQTADVPAVTGEYKQIENPRHFMIYCRKSGVQIPVRRE